MIIYVDENMSNYLAKALNTLQQPLNKNEKEPIEVRLIKEDFKEGCKDETWIPLVGNKKACIITQDYNLKRITHQLQLCKEHKLGMFYLRPPSKNGFNYWDMVLFVLKHWIEITKKAQKEEKPFGYRISSDGKFTNLY